MAKENKPRMHYMDLLKGIAIFMVVMGHVLTICIRDIDAATIFKIIGEVHMPIFFFISGWFTYKATADGRIRRPDLRRRALQLIVPMVIVSTLWVLQFPYSGLRSPMAPGFEGLWTSEYKNGYWFTPVLFVIMVLYALLAPVILRRRRPVLAITASIAILAGIPLFFIAVWPWRIPALENIPFIVPTAKMLFQLALAIVAMNIAVPWSETAYAPGRTRPGRLAVIWEYLGRKSLAIYLLHYFFLFPLTFLQQPARDMALSIVPLAVIAGAVAACIIAVTLAAEYLLSRSPLTARLICGNYNTISPKQQQQQQKQ